MNTAHVTLSTQHRPPASKQHNFSFLFFFVYYKEARGPRRLKLLENCFRSWPRLSSVEKMVTKSISFFQLNLHASDQRTGQITRISRQSQNKQYNHHLQFWIYGCLAVIPHCLPTGCCYINKRHSTDEDLCCWYDSDRYLPNTTTIGTPAPITVTHLLHQKQNINNENTCRLTISRRKISSQSVF